MVHYRRVTLELGPDGKLRSTPRLSLPLQIAILAAVVALVVGGLTLGALILGLALVLVPVALIAIAIAYLAFRFELWRARRSAGRHRDVFPRH